MAARLLLALALGAVVARFAATGFCGAPAASVARGSLAQRNGWRLDLMEFGPQGIGQLVTAEGFFIGEKAMFEIMNKNGYRYRMRATKEEEKKGLGEGITQIGPLKLRLAEAFGGTGAKPGLKRPDGYRGNAGVAGWDADLPRPGGGWKSLPK